MNIKVVEYDGYVLTDARVEGGCLVVRQFDVEDGLDKADTVFLTKETLVKLVEMLEDDMEEVLEFGVDEGEYLEEVVNEFGEDLPEYERYVDNTNLQKEYEMLMDKFEQMEKNKKD